MTEYLCEVCGVKTTMSRHIDVEPSSVPTTDECPNCGEDDPDKFRYL